MSVPRVRAPELAGAGGWLNTGGAALSLADLRGRIVLLDFWTFCCVNCLHVLDELRELEREFADVLVVVGVHSPKFVHEADHDALRAAVQRYDVAHPVLDDPDLVTWGRYAVRAWPTLVVVDPQGYVVGQFSGEGHEHALRVLVERLVAEHAAAGTLRRGDSPFRPEPVPPGDLTFPGKALLLPDGRLLVSDTGAHALALVDPADGSVLARIGVPGQRRLVDGAPDAARFAEPGGACLLPPEVAERVGYDVVVADTVNHALRGVSVADGSVRTVAGTGRQWMRGDPDSGPGAEVPLSSPWDCAWWPARGTVVVAMAGVHQLWAFDPLTGRVEVLAGTTQEGLVDGEPSRAWFAQTSGLAVSDDGETLWLVDAETSSLRRLRNGLVHTEVGSGLFDFGHVDGPADEALLQHPLGLVPLPDGSIAVCDTYNGALRVFDPTTRTVATLVAGLQEPSDAVVTPDGTALLVVESAAHRVTRVPLPDDVVRHVGDRHRTRRPSMDLAPGVVRLQVAFTPPAGQVLDDRYGPASYLVVSSSPESLVVQGAGAGTDLVRELVLAAPAAAGVDSGVLHVSARAASCDHDPAVEFPACHVHQQDWGVPVRVTESGSRTVTLPLGSVAHGTTESGDDYQA